ncbi:extracellular solute-binding protein [Brevundimonas sp.]|uniref:extracellular solute-binding protein n=1 Tax=Brevundimonas sp. TaxID=1871086 RepID=UPI002604B39C|nr:extracellular solute-binding protein [Brevundimonas sp.]
MTVLRPDRRATLGLMAGAAAGLAGCGARGQGTRLTFWAMGNEATNVPQLLPRFEALNPGITVDVQALPWTAAHQKLLTAYAGSSLPDLSQVGNTWVSEMAAIGAISELPASASDLLTDQFPAVLDTNRVEGRLVGVPWYVDTRLLFVRTDILAQAGYGAVPPTWAEWKTAMHAVKRVVGPDRFAILLPLNEFEQLLTLGLQGEAPLLRDDDTRGNFSSPSFVGALTFYKSLFDEGLAPVASSTQIANTWTEFDRGWFSFHFSGPWTIGEFRDRLSPTTRWNTAGVPGPTGPGASAPGGSSLVVYRSSPHQEAAWKLVRYLMDPQVQVEFNRITGNLPSRPSSWDAPAVVADPAIAAFRSQLERARPVPKAPEWERIVTEMQIVAERMVRGEFTPEAAGAEIDRRADRLLAKRRWMKERGRA